MGFTCNRSSGALAVVFATSSGGSVIDSVTYAYDPFGNRISRVQTGTSSSTARHVVDGWDTSKPGAIGSENFDVVLDLDGSNAVTMRRVFGSGFDDLVAREDAAGVVKWYGTDHLGSVRTFFDNSGTVTTTVDFDVSRESCPAVDPGISWLGVC